MDRLQQLKKEYYEEYGEIKGELSPAVVTSDIIIANLLDLLHNIDDPIIKNDLKAFIVELSYYSNY